MTDFERKKLKKISMYLTVIWWFDLSFPTIESLHYKIGSSLIQKANDNIFGISEVKKKQNLEPSALVLEEKSFCDH